MQLSCLISGMKASIRRKQSCLRRRALQTPAVSGSTVTSTSSSSTCAQSYAVGQQGHEAKNVRVLEFTCEFMERMCQRLIGYLCVTQLEKLSHDVAEQLANVVEGMPMFDCIFRAGHRWPEFSCTKDRIQA